MKLPKTLLSQTLARFDALIAEGRSIVDAGENIPPTYGTNVATGRNFLTSPGYKQIEAPKFVEWRTKSATLLDRVITRENIHRKAVEEMPDWQASPELLEGGISLLKAIKDDLQQGLLDSLSSQIEAEIASDYMAQAEQLLSEGQTGKCDHVPAAVLAGAVLEKALRTLADNHQPPVPTLNQNGDPKTLNPMIEELKKAGFFNEAKAKQLRGWAAIRNHAAHGEFDQFVKTDVAQMIQGISNFLADYLK